MASTDYKADTERGKEVVPPAAPPTVNCFAADITLRVLLFAASVIAIVSIVTANQTKIIPLLGEREAKFNHLKAFIYFVVALSIAGLYSIITTLASISVLSRPAFSTKFLLYFAFWDVLVLGLVASATGTAGGVAYVGWKGDDRVGWAELCSTYDKFCHHVAGSLAVSLFASVVLVLLSWLSIYALHSRIPK